MSAELKVFDDWMPELLDIVVQYCEGDDGEYKSLLDYCYKKFPAVFYVSNNLYRVEHVFAKHGSSPGGILLDMLSTGMVVPFVKFSRPVFSEDIKRNIICMIRRFPEAMNHMTYLRCRDNVPMIAIACINENIPVDVIRLMMQHGADINKPYRANSDTITVLNDLHFCGCPEDRIAEIDKIAHVAEK